MSGIFGCHRLFGAYVTMQQAGPAILEHTAGWTLRISPHASDSNRTSTRPARVRLDPCHSSRDHYVVVFAGSKARWVGRGNDTAVNEDSIVDCYVFMTPVTTNDAQGHGLRSALACIRRGLCGGVRCSNQIRWVPDHPVEMNAVRVTRRCGSQAVQPQGAYRRAFARLSRDTVSWPYGSDEVRARTGGTSAPN